MRCLSATLIAIWLGLLPRLSAATEGACEPIAGDGAARLISAVGHLKLTARSGSQGGQPHLTYRGGRVLDNPSVSLIFVGGYWNFGRGADEFRHVDGFARFYQSSPVQGLLRQYGAGPARYAGSMVTGGVAPRWIGMGRLQEIVLRRAEEDGPDRDPQRIYTVVLPPGVVLGDGQGTDSLQQMAGFHGDVQRGAFLDANGRPVYYATSVYSGVLGRNGINFNGDPKDAITITLSHEWAEAVTDPDVAHGKLGWYDDRLGEIGDLAIEQLPLPRTWVRIGGYAQQLLWSNRDGRYAAR